MYSLTVGNYSVRYDALPIGTDAYFFKSDKNKIIYQKGVAEEVKPRYSVESFHDWLNFLGVDHDYSERVLTCPRSGSYEIISITIRGKRETYFYEGHTGNSNFPKTLEELEKILL